MGNGSHASNFTTLIPQFYKDLPNIALMAQDILVHLHYLPSISYVADLLNGETIWLDFHEHFQKQTNRNRTTILSAQGPLVLSVPVVGGRSSQKVKTGEILIDSTQSWNKIHWKALQSAYAQTPFFNYYAPYFEKIYNQPPMTLWQLNLEMLSICLKCLGIKKSFVAMETFVPYPSLVFNDLRGNKPPNTKIRIEPYPYNQRFGKEFVANLSIIDLLANVGPDAMAYLRRISNE